MQVDVQPERFEVVFFDAAKIATLAAEVAAKVGLPADTNIRIEVDEQSMLTSSRVASHDPVVLAVKSGAFEDRSLPRQLSEDNLVDEVACLLQRVADRRTPAFADAPPDDELTRPQLASWDAYALGRTSRWQKVSFQPRHRYDFSLKCGFSPEADAAFERLWASDSLTWADIAGLGLEGPKPLDPEPGRRRK